MFGFSKGEKVEDKLKLALDLLGYFKLGTGQPSKNALDIIKKAKDKHELLDKIIDLCKDVNKPIAYLNIACAYELKGAKFRPQCIEYFNKFLSNPILDKTNEIHLIQHFYNITNEKLNLAVIFERLGSAYEGEYDFENALKCYMKSYNINPYECPIYVRLAGIYSKMNNLDKSIDILKSAKISPYYKVCEWDLGEGQVYKDESFIQVIDNYLNTYEEKKKKGYVYNPRKK